MKRSPKAPSQPCFCGSGRTYGVCCRPLHQGSEASSVEALMRSRYAAFVLGDAEYLLRTTGEGHELRSVPREEALRALRASASSFRYQGLTVVGAWEEATKGQVLFVARLYQRGTDVSFAELSDFVVQEGAWRYTGGTTVSGAPLQELLKGGLTRESFEAAIDEGEQD